MTDEKQKKCRHPRLKKDRTLGAHTGDYECEECGKVAWGSDWENQPDEPDVENEKK